MNARDEMKDIRAEIDEVDAKMVELFAQRMDNADKIAKAKRKGNIGITDTDRENEVIENALSRVPDDLKSETGMFIRMLMSLSKIRQKEALTGASQLHFPASETKKTKNISVAFQGISGAWGENAAISLYPDTNIKNYEYFEDVFFAVSKKEVDYGVVPIENSQTGAIGEVYDLLRQHGCFIINQIWIDIKHCLMAKPGTKLSDVREVLSHPEGFRQCHRFLKNKSWDTTVCKNTAVAAELVSQKSDSRCAAIGSQRAAELNGLEVIEANIAGDSSNRTRFIAIAAAPEYDQNSKTVSISFSASHISGALCSVLNPFMLSGINLSRIESRPAGSGKYRFFADLEANILEKATVEALSQAASFCDYFEVLGCY